MVIFHTNFGEIKINLFADKAPETVENFLSYVKDGFYDNTIFHRVINGFMIQGGGFEIGMKDKANKKQPIKNEANNGLNNKIGTIAMARTMAPHSASSQFFINVADNASLDFTEESAYGWGYCVFGAVVEGMEVVEEIKKVKTGRNGMHKDVPIEEVIITKAEICE